MRPRATFSFFIFFTLLVALSSSSLPLPPRLSFFLVHHLDFLEVPKHPYFTEFDERVTDGPTNRLTEDAWTHTKRHTLWMTVILLSFISC